MSPDKQWLLFPDLNTIIQTRLKFEAILIAWMNQFEESKICRIVLRKRVGRYSIALEVLGNSINPMLKDSKSGHIDDTLFYYNLIQNINVVANYSYIDGLNTVEIHIPKKEQRTLKKMIFAIVLGLISGLLLTLLPKEIESFIANDIVSPTVSALNGLISAVASVFIFTSILTSFCTMDNMDSFGKIGKGTLGMFCAVNLVTIVVGTVASVFFFGGAMNPGEFTKDLLGQIYKLILGLIPTNLIDPFVKKDLMQICVLAAFFGSILLTLGKRISTVRDFILNIQQILISALGLVCRLLPIVVFLCMVNIIIKHQIAAILQTWKMILFVGVGVWVTTAIICIWAKKSGAIEFSKIKEDLVPALVVGFGTGSRTSCTTQIHDMCLNELKLREDLVNFALPTSSMFCVYQKAFSMMAFVFGMLPIFGATISAIDVISIFVALNIIIYTIPPVPMGSMTVVAILWTMVGIPSSALAIAMPVDIIFGMIGTPAVILGTIALISIVNKKLS